MQVLVKRTVPYIRTLMLEMAVWDLSTNRGAPSSEMVGSGRFSDALRSS